MLIIAAFIEGISVSGQSQYAGRFYFRTGSCQTSKKSSVVVQAFSLPLQPAKAAPQIKEPPKNSAALGKGEKKKRSVLGTVPLQRFSYGFSGRPRVAASGVHGARALGRGLFAFGPIPRPPQVHWLACDASRVFARDALFPASDFASRCVGPDRRRLASAPGRHSRRVPEDRGAGRARWPPSPPASCLSRAAPVRQTDRASGPRRSPLLRFVSPSAFASRAVLVRDCRPPDYPAAALTPFSFPPAAAPTILAGVRLALAVFIRAVAPELPIPVARFALFWIHRNVSGVAPRVIRARFLRYLSRVLRNGPAAGHCRGLAEFRFSSPDVLHSTSSCGDARQRSWGSCRLPFAAFIRLQPFSFGGCSPLPWPRSHVPLSLAPPATFSVFATVVADPSSLWRAWADFS
jgi:hypothetical protein